MVSPDVAVERIVTGGSCIGALKDPAEAVGTEGYPP